MPRNRPLTKSQQDNLRRSAAQGCGQLITRLKKHANGEIDMKPSQIKAAQVVIGKVLPDLQSTQYEDITPQHGDVENIKELYASLKTQYLDDITPDELRAMAEAKESNDAVQ